MAQCTGGTTYDYVAQRKHDAAQKVLSRAADVWAKDGCDALSLDSLIAVLLHIFLSKWSEYGGVRKEVRTLKIWLSKVSTAQKEAATLVPTRTPEAIADVLSLLQAELSFAAEQWALGNPEDPLTAQALNAVEHILFSHRLITRPPNPKLSTSVRNL